MKQFVPNPGSNVDGVLLDEWELPRRAVFLTPGQAKFIAAFGEKKGARG
jgi:hypothetical protein